MPTYEYQCSQCHHAWELFQSIMAEAERKCPKCHRATAVRQIGIGSAILTGGRSAEPATPDSSSAAAPVSKGTDSTAKVESGAATSTKPSGNATTNTSPASPSATPAESASSSAPATATPSVPGSDTGKVNATHPAREGRGAGNVRDAIQRQRGGMDRSGRNMGKSPPKSIRNTSKRGRR